MVLLVLAVVAIAGLGLAVLGPEAAPQDEVERVRVGVGGDAESILLGHIIAELLEGAGIGSEVVTFGHARDARRALNLGEVDVAPMHTGGVWLDQLGWADPPGNVDSSFEPIRDADMQRGLVWLRPSRANATFAFVVAAPPAETAVLESLHDLAVAATADPELLLCVDPDFAERPDGLGEVARIYGMGDEVLTAQVLGVPPEEAVTGVARGGCAAGLTTATDGRAWLAGLRPLSDPRETFAAFVVAAVASADALDEHPGIDAALEPFGEPLTTERLAAWNGRVIGGDAVDVVATEAAEVLAGLHQQAVEEEEDAEG